MEKRDGYYDEEVKSRHYRGEKRIYKDGVWKIYPPTLRPEVITKTYVFSEATEAVTKQ